jgi:hypothetical protein
VGPTTAELESLNELIRFDHIYYKSEGGEKVKCVSSKGIASSNDVVNILSLPDSSVVAQQNVECPKPVTPAENSKWVDFESVLNLTDMVHFNDSLNDLVDLDALLQDNLLSTVTSGGTDNIQGTTSPVAKDTRVHSLVPQNEPAPKRRKTHNLRLSMPDNTNFKREKIVSPVQSKPLEVFSAEDLFTLDSSSSVSDSGYVSELSDASSPRSEISSVLGDEVWEESFTELFPSLV